MVLLLSVRCRFAIIAGLLLSLAAAVARADGDRGHGRAVVSATLDGGGGVANWNIVVVVAVVTVVFVVAIAVFIVVFTVVIAVVIVGFTVVIAVGSRLRAGLALQAPFGGFKGSSANTFKEQGKSAIEFYTRTKTVYVKY